MHLGVGLPHGLWQSTLQQQQQQQPSGGASAGSTATSVAAAAASGVESSAEALLPVPLLPGQGWHVLDEACRVEYLLDNGKLSQPPFAGQGVTSPPGGILFLGDSIDAYNMYELCDKLDGDDWKPGTRSAKPNDGKYNHAYDSLNYCVTKTGLRVGLFFLCGMNFDGPYWQNQVLHPDLRVERALEEWSKMPPLKGVPAPASPGAPLAPPSIVIISTNLWDLAGAYLRKEFLPTSRILSPPWLHSWMTNFTRVVQKVKTTFPPGTAIVHKTTALPLHHRGGGGGSSSEGGGGGGRGGGGEATVLPDFLSPTASRQINAAGRAVAQKEGLMILDAEAIASWLSPRTYLRDGSHPSAWFALEVDNLLLNMLKDHLLVQSGGRE